MKRIILIFTLMATTTFAQDIDEKLSGYIKEFNFKVPKKDNELVNPLFFLGRQLFHSRSLSLARDISCAHCHHPMRGTSDGLPLSIGTGSDGAILTRTQGNAKVTGRHSPALWNRSLKAAKHMFWDGRVSFHSSPKKDYVTTPTDLLSGPNPVLSEIADQMINAAAAQAMFPPTSIVEMRGENLVDENIDVVWEAIVENVLNDPANDIRTMMQLAYPGVEKFNMGHIGRALAHFQEIAFFIDDTPWDDYLRGDKNALDESEKRGALLFMEKARCVQCHQGTYFSTREFENVMVADIGLGEAPNDMGRYDVTGEEKDKYRFLVPNLRNVALTAPYMHNGSISSLEDVVLHYNHPMRTLRHYEPTDMNETYGRFYNDKFVRSWDMDKMRAIYNNRSDKLAMNLNLNRAEFLDLIRFLRKSLTSKRWIGK